MGTSHPCLPIPTAMLRLAALLALSCVAFVHCAEDAPAADAPAADRPQGDYGMINSGACRQVSCAEGFTCVTSRNGGSLIGQQQAMCVRFEASCRDLVGSDDDWCGNNNNAYGNNHYPGVGPGNGNQCNSD